MRVIAGSLRHRPLIAPDGSQTRPTLDRVKVAMFNILRPYLHQSVVLDLFGGSGALGIEAYSQGAKEVIINDISPIAQRAIQSNLKALGIHDHIKVTQQDYLQIIVHYKDTAKFNVILLDPPFMLTSYNQLLEQLANSNLLADGGIIMVETPRNEVLDALPTWKLKEYYYGEVKLTTYQCPLNK